MDVLGRGKVSLLCEGCSAKLDTWRLDERRGQIAAVGKVHWKAGGVGPHRAGLPQVLRYRCPGCRRDVSLARKELEDAVLTALTGRRNFIQVGTDLPGRYEGEPVAETTVSAKAPIPGGYRRPESRFPN